MKKFRIQPFEPRYQSQLVKLIERIQEGEFNIPIVESQRHELQHIPETFQKDKGNYWVALLDNQVIGAIAVLDIEHHAFELRDLFLDPEYRGLRTGYAKQLLDTVLTWSKQYDVQTIYLGTTLAFRAAHRFYEKNGFVEIAREEMPAYCKPMDCDEKFYKLEIENVMELRVAADYAERIWNKKDLSAIADYLDGSTVIHSLLGDYQGAQAMQQVVEAWLTGFPDLRVDNELIIEENDLVSLQWKARGTHLGEFKGRKSTGKSVSYKGVTVYRVRGGKIVEYWAYVDMHHLLSQIE